MSSGEDRENQIASRSVAAGRFDVGGFLDGAG
jgi:hypothetical protein